MSAGSGPGSTGAEESDEISGWDISGSETDVSPISLVSGSLGASEDIYELPAGEVLPSGLPQAASPHASAAVASSSAITLVKFLFVMIVIVPFG